MDKAVPEARHVLVCSTDGGREVILLLFCLCLCSYLSLESGRTELQTEKKKNRRVSDKTRHRTSKWKSRRRTSWEQLSCHLLPWRAVLIKLLLVEFTCGFPTAYIMSRWGCNIRLLGRYVDHFWQRQTALPFSPFLALFCFRQQSFCLQRASDWKRFTSAGWEAWAKYHSSPGCDPERTVHTTSNLWGFVRLLSWHQMKKPCAS